jgi:hypothetical protein
VKIDQIEASEPEMGEGFRDVRPQRDRIQPAGGGIVERRVPDLRCDDESFRAAGAEPAADGFLAAAAFHIRQPVRVDVSRVDEIAAAGLEGVEQGKRRGRVELRAQAVAAEAEPRDAQVRSGQRDPGLEAHRAGSRRPASRSNDSRIA